MEETVRTGEPVEGLCDHGVSIREHCAECAAENGQAPEDEPDEDEGEGEGEDDSPAGGAEPEEPEEEPGPPQDPDAMTCPVCQGWGITQTGSNVPEHATRQCQRCHGLGYLERQPAPAPTPQLAPVAGGSEPPAAARPADPWGSWGAATG